MKAPNFLVVADRGCGKAYVVDEPGGRERMPRLVDNFEIQEAHAKYGDIYADQAGRFSDHGGQGVHRGSAAVEELSIEEEQQTRGLKRLAERIDTLLEEHQPARWALAAPSQVNGALIDKLSQTARESLSINVAKDLVKTPAPELLRFFEG